MMRKRLSKRRWKARYLIGRWISREAVENHSLAAFVKGCEWHHHTQMLRRPTAYEVAGGWSVLSGIRPRFDTVNAPLSELAQRAAGRAA